MKNWEATYTGRIYTINYEQLTENQEEETRSLIKYIGLAWEKACLSPEKNKRSVRTASQWQVRSKVYQGSSNQWQNFAPFLHDEIN